jgi:hypothetical protein
MLVCLTKSVTASKKHEPRNGPYFDFVLLDSIGKKVSGQQAYVIYAVQCSRKPNNRRLMQKVKDDRE